jgi:uncharacterized protein with LGFP repeats
MATIDEVRQKLKGMTEEEFRDFRIRYGGTEETREEYVQHFVQNPHKDRVFCEKIGLVSEADKLTRATILYADANVASANAAKQSAEWARVSGIAAIVAIVIAVVSLIVSIARK